VVQSCGSERLQLRQESPMRFVNGRDAQVDVALIYVIFAYK
jgi:hypothetical protein